MKNSIHKQKFIISMLIFSFLISTLIIFTFRADKNTNNKITGYIKSIGWSIEETPHEISHYKIPLEFDMVFKAYNDIQKKSGYDLSKYKGMTVSSYTYRVLNHKMSDTNEVYATVIFCKGEIIGGEISSDTDAKFIHEITNTKDLISG